MKSSFQYSPFSAINLFFLVHCCIYSFLILVNRYVVVSSTCRHPFPSIFFYKNCKSITHLQFLSIWEQDPDNVNFLVKKKSIKPVVKNGLYIEWVVVWCIEWQCHEGLRVGNGEVFPLMSPCHHRSFLKFPLPNQCSKVLSKPTAIQTELQRSSFQSRAVNRFCNKSSKIYHIVVYH